MRRTLLVSAIPIMLGAWATAPVVAQTPPNVTNAPVGNGGNGGNQMQGQHQGQGQSAYGGNSNQRQGQSTTVSGVGNSYNTQAPDVSIPSIGGGGSDCPVVGFGVGGSGLGGGGGFGPSWISADCNTRKLAELLSRLGYRDAAISVLADHFPEVKRALTPVSAPTAAPFPVPVVAASKPDWCATSSPSERHRHKDVCG